MVNQDHQANVENLDLKDNRVHKDQVDNQDQEENAENLDLGGNQDNKDRRYAALITYELNVHK